MIVKNINGTTDNRCKCGSWLKHWVNYSKEAIPAFCPVKDCIKRPVVGAHVQKTGSADKLWFIIPVCEVHSEPVEYLEVDDLLKLASANQQETCELSSVGHSFRR